MTTSKAEKKALKAEEKALKAEEKADAADTKAAKAESKVAEKKQTVAESVYEGALRRVQENEKIAISSADKKAALDALALAEAGLKAEREAEVLAKTK